MDPFSIPMFPCVFVHVLLLCKYYYDIVQEFCGRKNLVLRLFCYRDPHPPTL